ncbi:MAG: hypothetical protein CSA81_00505 [Acidobacteria bacterium]|nr:MAG: hypothetical protein CSA81_00505 [Acidobacteriota bacterium]
MRKRKKPLTKLVIAVCMIAIFGSILLPSLASAGELLDKVLSQKGRQGGPHWVKEGEMPSLGDAFGTPQGNDHSMKPPKGDGTMERILIIVLSGLRDIMSDLLVKGTQLLRSMISKDVANEVFFSEKSKAGILSGWSFVRDFLNLFYLLILIFIAIATILRVNQFSDKKIFIYVLISALLINFSLPITMVVIDISNLSTSFFAELIEELDPGATFLNNSNFQAIWRDNLSSELVRTFVEALILMFMTITIFFLAITLIIRYVAFWVLLILSPFAIFSFAMPNKSGVGNFWNEWSKKLFSYAFYAPVLLFFMALEIILTKALGESFTNTSSSSSIGIGLTAFAIQQIVLFYLLFYGYSVAKQIAAGSGEAVTKILNKGQSVATGALKYASGYKTAAYGYGATKNYAKDVGKGAWNAAKERVPVLRRFASREAVEKRKRRAERYEALFAGGEIKEKQEMEDATKQAKENKDKGGKTKTEYQSDLDKNKIKAQAAAINMSEDGMIQDEADADQTLRAAKGNDTVKRKMGENVRKKIREEVKDGRLTTEKDYLDRKAVLTHDAWDVASGKENEVAVKDIQREMMKKNAHVVLDADIQEGSNLIQGGNAGELEAALRTNIALQNVIKAEEERMKAINPNWAGFADDAAKARWLKQSSGSANLSLGGIRKSTYAQHLKGKSLADVLQQKGPEYFDNQEVQDYISNQYAKSPENTKRAIDIHASGDVADRNTVKAKVYNIVGASQTTKTSRGPQSSKQTQSDQKTNESQDEVVIYGSDGKPYQDDGRGTMGPRSTTKLG